MQQLNAEKGEEEISKEGVATKPAVSGFVRWLQHTQCALPAWHRIRRRVALPSSSSPLDAPPTGTKARCRQSSDDAPGKSSWKQRQDWRLHQRMTQKDRFAIKERNDENPEPYDSQCHRIGGAVRVVCLLQSCAAGRRRGPEAGGLVGRQDGR